MAPPRAHKTTKYNENFFRSWGGPGPTAVGAAVILVVVLGFYLAFTKSLPFSSSGYEVQATFSNAVNISKKAPVRIAGVNVGEVKSVERKGENSVVTFTVSDEGRPIHQDASAEIRPRIFLEGNFFVDLDPGSPSSPEMGSDPQIPVTRTSTAVQLDEILTALQAPERSNLSALLEGLGTAFTYQPTAADDVGQDPDVRGKTAAEALNAAFGYGGKANRTTAIVNEALLGTKNGDLAGLLVAGNRTFKALVGRETQLKDLITNFSTFTGALADESGNLSKTVQLLAPTLGVTRKSLVDLNAALPPLRGLSIAVRPGIAELPKTIAYGRPWLRQVRPLLAKRELGGIAHYLEVGTPATAGATHETILGLPQLTNFNRCVSQNLIPTGNVVLQDNYGGSDFTSGQPNYREFFYASAGLAGESANFDGNGIYLRFQPGGGPFSVNTPNPSGAKGVPPFVPPADQLYGHNIAQPLATRPALTGMPVIRSDVPCFKSQRPDLNGPAAAAGPPSPATTSP